MADLLVQIGNQPVVSGACAAHLFFGEIDCPEHRPHSLVDGVLAFEVAGGNLRHVDLVEGIEIEKPLGHYERKVRRNK